MLVVAVGFVPVEAQVPAPVEMVVEETANTGEVQEGVGNAPEEGL